MKEEAGKVLFSVTPTDDIEALDKIREALAVYLNLPASPIVYDDSFAAMRLQQQIENLQHSQRMAVRELQFNEKLLVAQSDTIHEKNITISQQQSVIEQQNKIIEKISSKSIMMDSVENKEELEEIFDGLKVGKSEFLKKQLGIDFNPVTSLKTLGKKLIGKDDELQIGFERIKQKRKLNNNFSEFDIKMTRRALELAAIGVGRVSPSPLVGCVIVAENGEIVGEGTYIFENVTHAEVFALKQAGKKRKAATAYVSLEPHAHTGRTKPCTEALINAGIKRVVCPIEDPNPLVSGKGFQVLRENGIEVVTGILREEAAKLNEKFCVWHQKSRPFVHLKLAMSLDGRISLKNSVSTTLSGKESAKRVQDLRHEHDAILVGGNTAFVDNPSLTDRSGKPRRRKLVRVVLDNRLQIPLDSTLVNTAKETPTLIVSNSNDDEKIEKLIESRC